MVLASQVAVLGSNRISRFNSQNESKNTQPQFNSLKRIQSQEVPLNKPNLNMTNQGFTLQENIPENSQDAESDIYELYILIFTKMLLIDLNMMIEVTRSSLNLIIQLN